MTLRSDAGAVCDEVVDERVTQHEKFGEQNHPDGTGGHARKVIADLRRSQCQEAFRAGQGTWQHVLSEEVAEAYAEDDSDKLREELVQVAAVAVAWIEAIDRRPRCKFCKTDRGVEIGPDPFAFEIHADDTPVPLCGPCFDVQRDEI